MIEERHVRELLERSEDDAALVLVEGRAEVVAPAGLASEPYRGAAVLMTRADLVDRLGTADPSEDRLRTLASTLATMAGELGA
ncbi:hypothetical protein [Streptomyces lavendofoliae]|uniref:hypothetical protein n=1 Tax=Streptomyces lavendofoliae TaxID=67314 RepID=UPI003D938471